MAFPVVASTNSGNSGGNASTHVINMPSGATTGDLILVAFTNDGSATVSVNSGTNWTQVFSTANGTNSRLTVYRKILDGSGDNLTLATSANEGSAHASYRITGFNALTVPEFGTAATGSSANPNPPNLDPSAWATEDTLWIVIYGWDGNVSHTSYPANYTSNQVTDRWANTNGCGVAIATRNNAASSEDPGTATIGTEDWIAQTMAIRPESYAHGQAQAHIKTTAQGYGQSQADIKATGRGFGQSQADIKQTYFSHGQTQATMLAAFVGAFGQANADIKQTYPLCTGTAGGGDAAILGSDTAILGTMVLGSDSSGSGQVCEGAFGQAQAYIVKTQFVHGQAQADVKATSNAHGQAQADIKATSFAHAQAQADIKAVGYGFGQAQAKINAFAVNAHGQAQAYIQGQGLVFGQAQADIKAVGYGFGQAQGDIKQTYYVHGQAQALIISGRFAHGQAQADIKAISRGLGQAQADIKQTYPLCTGSGSGDGTGAILGSDTAILGTMILGSSEDSGGTVCIGLFGQAQAYIVASKYAHGQAQADIKAISNAHGQSQADIKQTYYVHGQTQGYILISNFAHGQAQADIKAVGYAFGQTQAEIKQTYYVHGQAQALIGQLGRAYGQAQADIKAVSNAHGQAQADIKAVGYGFGQAQADIKQTYFAYGQAQALIVQTNNAHGQAQADIKATTNAHGQSQGEIKQTYYVHGQSQGYIQTSRFAHGQAQAYIQTGFTASYGQAQAYIIPQYIHFLDTFTRSATNVNQSSNMNYPDYGIYSGNSSVASESNVIDGSKIVIDYRDFFATRFAANVPVDITGESTLSMQFKLTDYVSIDDFYFEVSIGQAGVTDGFIGMWTDSGDIYLFAGTNFASAPFVPGNGFTYKFLLFAGHTEAKAKWWLANDGITDYPEPSDWNLTVTPNVSFVGTSAFFWSEVFGPLGETMEVDNLSIYAPEPPAWLAFGQAQALIRKTIAHGQAQAQIKKVDFNRHGQARAFIRKSAGYGQAQALITKAVSRSGQAQAQIATPGRGNGQAQALITTTRPNGQAQAWILNRWFPVGQANAYIRQHQQWHAQAQAQIRVFNQPAHGQAQALINGFQGFGQAQAFIVGGTVYGNTQSGQAAALIDRALGWGQAQAQIKRTSRSHGQAMALIYRKMAHGQAQGYIRKGTQSTAYGQAQASIRYQNLAFGLALALIAKGAGHGQAQARINAFGTKGYGQAQAFIRRTDTIVRSGQCQAQIKRSDPVGQAQALIAGGRYLVDFNGYKLPGYAQIEEFESPASITDHNPTYQDGPFDEYLGLDNKQISLRMKVAGETYRSVKDQTQAAASMVRSSRGWEKLYIQRYDRYYTALTKRVVTEKTVAESMRTLDYVVEWEVKPWLISDTVNQISGTGTIDTGARPLDNGGWTPARVIISGTNVTISGYTEHGEFTGFVSISGTVTDMVINTQEYTSTINGVNANNQMYNPDYALFVGPGQTFFEVSGASSCTIEWQDRWYL